jgi:transposase
MATRRNSYDASFKAKAVELSHVRGNARAVAEELGIPAELLYRWRREHNQYGKNSFPGNGRALQTDTEKELARVKAELHNTAMERDILKKAISIFSKSDGKSTSS